MILAQTDFIGDIELTQSADITTALNSFITTNEKKYLRLVLGDDLYIKFNADLTDGVPQTTIYKDLLDGKNYEIGSLYYVYRGLKSMLKYFVFYQYKMGTYTTDTDTGTAILQKDASIRESRFNVERDANDAWNKGVEILQEVIFYIFNNISDFSTYSGMNLKTKHQFYKG